MTWPVKRVVGGIAANNAVKVQAAMQASVNPTQIAEAFMHTHPQASDDIAQDRARARDWATANISINSAPLVAVVNRIYAEGWVTGDKAARSEIKDAAIKKALTIDQIANDPNANIWEGYEPGNTAAAALISPPGGLQTLLDKAQVTIKSIDQTTLDKLGNTLADQIAKGSSVADTADAISSLLTDPSRALTISVTETSRAVNQASMARYQEAQIQEMQWLGIDPCEICADNDGETVQIGDLFPSGDDAPPAHPNCVCTVIPVLPELAGLNLAAQPDTNKFVPGPNEVDAAISRLEILPNADHPDLDKPEKYVETPWEVTPTPTVAPLAWDKAKLVVVNLQDLLATDEFMKRKKVKEHIFSMGAATTPYRNFALVLKRDGQQIIMDGHHRLFAMWLLGMDTAPVWQVEEK